MRVERTSTQLLLAVFRDSEDISKKLGVSVFALAGISHLCHLLHELPNALAVFERAAPHKCRAISSEAFIFLYEVGVWAFSLAKCRALEHHVVQGDAHRSLEENKNTHVSKTMIMFELDQALEIKSASK